jgi:hypothetical protein
VTPVAKRDFTILIKPHMSNYAIIVASRPLRFLIFAICFISPCFYASGQGEIPVNMYAGTGYIEIPISNVSVRDVSDAVSLTYSIKGVKLQERGGKFGVSWDLSAGGSIVREVRGLPDDFKGTGNDRRRGWLYQKYGTTTNLSADVAALPNTSDHSSPSVCTDELNDYNQLNGYGYDHDTEPDLFYFSAGGVSGSFVFDNANAATPVIRLIPYQDIKIEPAFNPGASSPKITGFTITSNTGIVYTFNESVWETRFSKKLIAESTVEFLKTHYEQYSKTGNHDNQAVGYSTEWKLSKMTATNSSDELLYEYTSESVASIDTVRAYILRNSNNQFYPVDVYSDSIVTTYKNLSKIYVRDTPATQKRALELVESGGMVSSIKIYDHRKGVTDFVKQFDLVYRTVGTKTFLASITERSGSESIPPYTFSYQVEYLPSKYSKDQDFWGYYNNKSNLHLAPKLYVYPGLSPGERFRIEPLSGYIEGETQFTLPGADRTVDTLYIQSGTLKSIHYPSGGYTQIKYESNEYYDTIANQNFKGGGLRIKSLHYYDAAHADPVITHYTYSDANGKSFGRLLSKPNFAMLTWEYRDPFSTTEQIPDIDDMNVWQNPQKIIVRMEQDLSSAVFTRGSAVGYKQVKVTRPGSGYSIHDFELAAPYGTSTSGSWAATVNKYARTTGCATVQWYTCGINGFPFAPNPNFDLERGMPIRSREYKDGDTLVSESQTTYQYVYKTGSAADNVWGVRFEKYPNSDVNIFLFGKYYLLTDVARVPSLVTATTYDAKNPSRSQVHTTQYFYESASHKLLSRVKSTLPDGTVYQTYTKYPLDYPNTSVYYDNATECINILKTTGRNGIPIETYTTVTKTGDVEKVISGVLTQFSSFDNFGKVLPEKTLSWRSGSPIAMAQFIPSWTDAYFHADSRYEVVNTVKSYSGAYLKPVQAVGEDRVERTIIWGYNSTAPVISTWGVSASQFAFSDFETTTNVVFNEIPNPIVTYGSGRTGSKSIYLTQTALHSTLTKASGTYTLSCWVSSTGNATLNVKIKNAAGTTTYYNQNHVFTRISAANTYEYFEQNIPADASLQTFKVEISYVSGDCYIDDVGFYPSYTSLTTSTYIFPFGPNATTTRHNTGFVEYDALGRVKYVKDKDGNIIKKSTLNLNTY